MKALFTLLFVMTFALSSQANDVPKPEGCLGGDPKCQPVRAGEVEVEGSAVEQGPGKREAFGGKPACAACVAQEAQKNGRGNGVSTEAPTSGNGKTQ